MTRANTAKQLLALIDPECGPASCWPFLGNVAHNGYGHIRRGQKKTVKAHRWAYEHFYGVEPGKMLVMHTCDNKLCCNPLHLKLGTHKENMKDLADKGLKRSLCYESIKALRELGLTQKQIAEEMNCSSHTVYEILRKFR